MQTVIRASSLRRFDDHKRAGKATRGHTPIVAGGPADLEARTRYPHTRKVPSMGYGDPSVLKSGFHNKKIGAVVQKGAWLGYPIFTLTLEERATCSRSCHHWLDCYGNEMNWAHRFQHGKALEIVIEHEIRALIKQHGNIVVRLHVLGDFYSVQYVKFWENLVLMFPQLHVWGYTGWQPDTKIGKEIARVQRTLWRYFAVRFSVSELRRKPGRPTNRFAVSIKSVADAPKGSIVCPEQVGTDEHGKTAMCATCGLCWSTKKPIAFLDH